MAGSIKAIGRLDVTTNTSIVTFSSIPQGYTDLILRWTGVQSGGGNDDLRINFNSSIQSIYFNNQLYLSNSAYAGNNSSSTYGTVGYIIGTNYSNFTNTSGQVYIFDYKNTSKNKKWISDSCGITNVTGSTILVTSSGMFQSLSAISSIELSCSSGSFTPGSGFYLYGVK